jgi:GT2 family glycosyltransferase
MSLQKTAIAILSFNHPDLTGRCVRAALSNTTRAVFLLHNGSADKHEKRLRDEFHPESYPNVTHLRLTANAGFSGGCNYLLRHIFSLSEYEWVLLVTNDCQLQSLTDAPATPGLFAPLIYRRSTDKVDSLGATFEPWTGRLRHRRNDNEPIKTKAARFNPKIFYVPGTAFWIHRETWRSIGGFDESLHTYWEDVDLSVKAQRLGLTVSVHATTTLIHGVGKTCHKQPFYTQYLFRRNRKTISRRYSPRWLRPLQSLWL